MINKPYLSKSFVLFVLSLSIAIILLFRSTYNASDLEIVPDSVEYSIAAHRLLTDQTYSIVIDGRSWPPRYQPWFSLLVIMPAYLLFGEELGNAVFPVIFSGIVGIAFAFIIGCRTSGPISGVTASLSLLSLSWYRQLSRQVMTDVPCVALIIIACFLYMHLRSVSSNFKAPYLLAGIISGLCAAFRPVCSSVALPFLWLTVHNYPKRNTLFQMILVLTPLLLVVILSMVYNKLTFGSPVRTGYHFWCPVPYDQSGMTFSFSYFFVNLKSITLSVIPILILALTIMIFYDRSRPQPMIIGTTKESVRSIIEFTLITCIPIIGLHLFYFYTNQRFFLPFMSLLAILFGIIIGIKLQNISRGVVKLLQLVIIIGALFLRLLYPDPEPPRRMAVDRVNNLTPNNAMIISTIDPAYLEFMTCRFSKRLILPISRRIEYASKQVAWQRAPCVKSKPTSQLDHRYEGLAKSNAKDVVPYVADGGESRISLAISNGVPVYLETSHLTNRDMQVVMSIRQQFRLARCADYLYRLEWKTPKPSFP